MVSVVSFLPLLQPLEELNLAGMIDVMRGDSPDKGHILVLAPGRQFEELAWWKLFDRLPQLKMFLLQDGQICLPGLFVQHSRDLKPVTSF